LLDFSGSLDTTSFGSGNGYVIQDIPTASDMVDSLALQPDGKILLGGTCDNKFCIARFNSDGSLDTTSFGSGNGYVVQDISTGSDMVILLHYNLMERYY
jgi:WD40 repeat protein